MVELFGWTSSLLLASCGAPQAYKCWKQQHSHGISYIYLIMWLMGVLLAMIFIALADIALIHKMPLYMNYLANVFFSGVILRYRIWPHDSIPAGHS